MKNDSTYPDINGLLGDLGNLVPDKGAAVAPADTQAGTGGQIQPDGEDEDWELFRKNLSLYNFREKKDDRMICKLDRDLADSLDDCDIDRKCRSDIVNAIVRTFVNRYLPRLRQYKRNNRSLLDSAPNNI